MVQRLVSGENTALNGDNLTVTLTCDIGANWHNSGIDPLVFLLTNQDKVRFDEDFIFYNQTRTPNSSVILQTITNQAIIQVDLKLLDSDIQKIAFCLVIDGADTIANLDKLTLNINNTLEFNVSLIDRCEKSLIIGHCYLYKGIWKFRALGQGYHGGIHPLVMNYGVEVDESISDESSFESADVDRLSSNSDVTLSNTENVLETIIDEPAEIITEVQPIPTEQQLVDIKNDESEIFESNLNSENTTLFDETSIEQQTSPLSLDAQADFEQIQQTQALIQTEKYDELDLRVLSISSVLRPLLAPFKFNIEQYQLNNRHFKLVFVLEATHSMTYQFISSNVQIILSRVILAADYFDQEKSMDLWAFAEKCKQYSSVTLENQATYIKDLQTKKNKSLFSSAFSVLPDLGIRNNEVPVMKELLDTYKHSDEPVMIVFVTDGHIERIDDIRQILTQSTTTNIFWKFIGLCGSDYGIIQELNNRTDPFIDNTHLFRIDSFGRVSNNNFYENFFIGINYWLEKISSKEKVVDNSDRL